MLELLQSDLWTASHIDVGIIIMDSCAALQILCKDSSGEVVRQNGTVGWFFDTLRGTGS